MSPLQLLQNWSATTTETFRPTKTKFHRANFENLKLKDSPGEGDGDGRGEQLRIDDGCNTKDGETSKTKWQTMLPKHLAGDPDGQKQQRRGTQAGEW